jgi:aryl-alcohol dehydrogenase-like predicted oxidoreductase
VLEAVKELADIRDVSRAQIAIAWLLHQHQVTAPIIGATKEHHLTDAVAAVDIKLTSKSYPSWRNTMLLTKVWPPLERDKMR